MAREARGRSGTLSAGDAAPDFRLEGTSGKSVRLAELRGSRVVLYFYPRDDTPGCTREACDFRDGLARVRAAGAQVLGVSRDSLAAHERFRSRYHLPFELLSDPDNAVATAYGAYGQKTLYGKHLVGTIRSTFLIDEHGRVRAAWSPVRVDGHVEQVLAALQQVPALAPSPKAAARKPARKKAATRKVAKRPARKAAQRGSRKT